MPSISNGGCSRGEGLSLAMTALSVDSRSNPAGFPKAVPRRVLLCMESEPFPWLAFARLTANQPGRVQAHADLRRGGRRYEATVLPNCGAPFRHEDAEFLEAPAVGLLVPRCRPELRC